jgi:hypothetical protein
MAALYECVQHPARTLPNCHNCGTNLLTPQALQQKKMARDCYSTH